MFCFVSYVLSLGAFRIPNIFLRNGASILGERHTTIFIKQTSLAWKIYETHRYYQDRFYYYQHRSRQKEGGQYSKPKWQQCHTQHLTDGSCFIHNEPPIILFLYQYIRIRQIWHNFFQKPTSATPLLPQKHPPPRLLYLWFFFKSAKRRGVITQFPMQ